MRSFRALALGGVAAVAGAALAAGVSADIVVGNTPYLSVSDSPFDDPNKALWLEDFEDGIFDLAGVTVTNGVVKGPGIHRDSVDGDDGVLDGWGREGWAMKIRNRAPIADFHFDADVIGGLPSLFGFAWTDGRAGTEYEIRAWDAQGNEIDSTSVVLGEQGRRGNTNEDRFIGVMNDTGISRVLVTSGSSGFEIDHIQYSEIVPVPAPGALALLGIAGLISRRRR